MSTCTSTTHYAGCPCHEERRDEEIERLRAELAEAHRDGRNALGLRLLLRPGEWRRRVDGEQADTSDLGQDVAMLVFLLHKDRQELRELRRKVGEWFARLGEGLEINVMREMKEEAKK